MRHHPLLLSLLGIVAAMLLLAGAGESRGYERRQTSAEDRAAAVKAGMVVNFIRYTRWPDTAFADDKAPIIVTLVGTDPIDRALAAATRSEVIGGRPVQLRRVWYPSPRPGEPFPRVEDLSTFYDTLRASHVVYFGDSENQRLDHIFKELHEKPVLTISDLPRFAERGGMLGFVIRDRRIAFDANVDVINAAKLRVNSQVLNLARIVRNPERPEGSP